MHTEDSAEGGNIKRGVRVRVTRVHSRAETVRTPSRYELEYFLHFISRYTNRVGIHQRLIERGVVAAQCKRGRLETHCLDVLKTSVFSTDMSDKWGKMYMLLQSAAYRAGE